MSVFTMNRYPVHMVPSSVGTVNSRETQLLPTVKVETKTENEDDPDSKAIHSGHFMLSRIHGTSQSDDEDDDEDSTARSPAHTGFNFVDASKETCRTYKFGPKSTQTLAIDASLTKLFEKLTLAYSGKLTSPKWKQFRGMHLKVVDKVRLNNVIWREWVMQYVYRRSPQVCQFATPLSDDLHTKPEAIVLEGYYWKRRLDTITEEYKRSRKFFKRLVERRLDDGNELGFLSDDQHHSELLSKVGEVRSLTAIPRQQQTSNTDLVLNSRDLQDMMDLSDSLFSSLNSPFAFPNPRELSGFGYGDLIQPGLLQLQPLLEDEFMELEPIPELINVRSPLSQSGSSDLMFGRIAAGNTTSDSQSGSFKSSVDIEMTASPQLPASPQILASPQPMAQSPSPAPSTPGSSSLFQSPQASPATPETQMLMDTDNIIMNHLQMLQNQQKMQNERKLQKQIAHQKQIEQQKQQMKHQQHLKKQKLLEQQRQQKLLQQQQQLEQQKQLEQQQKLQEQQKQQERQKQLTVLQANLMKAHSSGNTAVAAFLLDELLKVLTSGADAQTDTSANSQTVAVDNNQTVSLSNTISDTSQQTGSINSDLQTALLNNKFQIATQTLNEQNISPEKIDLFSQPSTYCQSTQFKSNQLSHVTNSPSDILAALNAGNRMISQDSVRKIVLPKQPQPIKDKAGFTVPAVPPQSARVKQRILAPAPSQTQTQSQATSLSQQNSKSYLAQLLTTGTYPGAIIKVKSEADKSTQGQGQSVSFQPILPADNSRTATASNSIKSIQSAPAAISIDLQKVTDFPTSVLLAAASHAFSPAVSVHEMLQSATDSVATGTASTTVVSSPGHSQSEAAPQSPSFSLGPVPTSPVTSPGSIFDETRSPEIGSLHDDSDFKKTTHITAELKRRQNIKGGFDLLHTLIPSISQNPNAKISKAAMLQKTAEYCKKLKSERSQMQNEADILKQEINSLNQQISVCQSQLPATGVPFNRQRADQMKEMFEEYVKQRTLTNWKFWIFSIIIRNLFDSFNNMVSTASVDELCRTVLAWLDQYCSLVALRPIASDAMRFLSTTTSILSDPSRVPEQAAQAVIKKPTENKQPRT